MLLPSTCMHSWKCKNQLLSFLPVVDQLLSFLPVEDWGSLFWGLKSWWSPGFFNLLLICFKLSPIEVEVWVGVGKHPRVDGWGDQKGPHSSVLSRTLHLHTRQGNILVIWVVHLLYIYCKYLPLLLPLATFRLGVGVDRYTAVFYSVHNNVHIFTGPDRDIINSRVQLLEAIQELWSSGEDTCHRTRGVSSSNPDGDPSFSADCFQQGSQECFYLSYWNYSCLINVWRWLLETFCFSKLNKISLQSKIVKNIQNLHNVFWGGLNLQPWCPEREDREDCLIIVIFVGMVSEPPVSSPPFPGVFTNSPWILSRRALQHFAHT